MANVHVGRWRARPPSAFCFSSRTENKRSFHDLLSATVSLLVYLFFIFFAFLCFCCLVQLVLTCCLVTLHTTQLPGAPREASLDKLPQVPALTLDLSSAFMNQQCMSNNVSSIIKMHKKDCFDQLIKCNKTHPEIYIYISPRKNCPGFANSVLVMTL